MDDAAATNSGFRTDDGSLHNNSARAKACRRGDMCARMDESAEYSVTERALKPLTDELTIMIVSHRDHY